MIQGMMCMVNRIQHHIDWYYMTGMVYAGGGGAVGETGCVLNFYTVLQLGCSVFNNMKNVYSRSSIYIPGKYYVLRAFYIFTGAHTQTKTYYAYM